MHDFDGPFPFPLHPPMTTQTYTLSLHDALPISSTNSGHPSRCRRTHPHTPRRLLTILPAVGPSGSYARPPTAGQCTRCRAQGQHEEPHTPTEALWTTDRHVVDRCHNGRRHRTRPPTPQSGRGAHDPRAHDPTEENHHAGRCPHTRHREGPWLTAKPWTWTHSRSATASSCSTSPVATTTSPTCGSCVPWTTCARSTRYRSVPRTWPVHCANWPPHTPRSPSPTTDCATDWTSSAPTGSSTASTTPPEQAAWPATATASRCTSSANSATGPTARSKTSWAPGWRRSTSPAWSSPTSWTTCGAWPRPTAPAGTRTSTGAC